MIEQPDLLSLPPAARWSDPETSHDAAASVENLTESRRMVLDVLRVHGPATDEMIAARWVPPRPRISPSGLRTRRAELVRAGLVEDSGERRRLRSGRAAIVWRAT